MNQAANRDVTKFCNSFEVSVQGALPTHVTKEHYLRALTTSIRKTPKLMDCDKTSIGAAILTSAQLGLLPDVNGQCYLIPFKRECQLIIGYQGLIDLAYRTNKIESIRSDVVCEKDEFDYQEGMNPTLYHKRNLREKRGKPYAVYAIAKIVDGGQVYVVLSKEEVEAVKKSSKASGSSFSPWNGDFETEMWKKTAVRRLSKMLPKSIELIEALDFDNKQYERDIDARVVEPPADLSRTLGNTPRSPTPEEYQETETISNPSDTATNIDEDAVRNSAPTEKEHLIKQCSDSALMVEGCKILTDAFLESNKCDSLTKLTIAKLKELYSVLEPEIRKWEAKQ